MRFSQPPPQVCLHNVKASGEKFKVAFLAFLTSRANGENISRRIWSLSNVEIELLGQSHVKYNKKNNIQKIFYFNWQRPQVLKF